MLAIRMQRVGRKGHPEYRVVVQDARLTPSSGRVVARVGHYNPHTKQTSLDKEKIEYYLANGAKPTPRVVGILQTEKVNLPSWVETPSTDKNRVIKNAEKLRRNQPKEMQNETEAVVENSEAPAEEVSEVAAEDTPVSSEDSNEQPA
jgi:small subunit ribosomal protein S16